MGANRIRLSNEERNLIRDYSRANPDLTQLQLSEWFLAEYNKQPSQSTICRIISDLRDAESLTTEEEIKYGKLNRCQYPLIEDALFSWLTQVQPDAPTFEDIREVALMLWAEIYPKKGVPYFSTSWYQGFKARKRLGGKSATIYSDAVAQQKKHVLDRIKAYEPRNVYNCDETEISWIIDHPQRYLDRDEYKTRSYITAHLAVNADGSDKRKPLYIGWDSTPWEENIEDTKRFSDTCIWRNNRIASMTTSLMKEWLLDFNQELVKQDRKILMVMSNRASHVAAIAQLKDVESKESCLTHIEAVFLPRNSRSRVQPLYQGIIWFAKCNYEIQVASYMIKELNITPNPGKNMELLKSIEWFNQAWQSVSPDIIVTSWHKSELYPSESKPTLLLTTEELQKEELALTQKLLWLVTELKPNPNFYGAEAVYSMLNGPEYTKLSADLIKEISKEHNPWYFEGGEKIFDEPEKVEVKEEHRNNDEPEKEIIPKMTHFQGSAAIKDVLIYAAQQGFNYKKIAEDLEELARHAMWKSA